MSRLFKPVFTLYVGYFVHRIHLYGGRTDQEQTSIFLTRITGGGHRLLIAVFYGMNSAIARRSWVGGMSELAYLEGSVLKKSTDRPIASMLRPRLRAELCTQSDRILTSLLPRLRWPLLDHARPVALACCFVIDSCPPENGSPVS